MMKAWFEAAQFGADSQSVIAMRMMRLASGGPLAEAQGLMMSALVNGKSLETAAVKAYAPYRRAVRANRRRLET
jgi:hypothetical protein